MKSWIHTGDNVLCVGLDIDTLNVIYGLVGAGGRVIGVDQEHGVANAPKPVDGVETLVMDAFDLMGLRALGIDFDHAVLDIAQWSGRDSTLDSLSLLNQYWQAFPGLRSIMVKSKALLQMGQKLVDSKLLNPDQKLVRLRLDDAPLPPASPPAAAPGARPNDLTTGKIVCAVGVLEYRATIPWVVRDGDTVLEIGAQAGLTTKLAKKANPSGRVVGSDIGPQSVEHAIRQGKGYDIEWVVLDAWDLAGLKALGEWTVIYVDISGISGRNSVQDALSLMLSYFRLIPTLRTVVIKSRSLRDLSQRFVRLDPIEPKTEAPATK